MSSIKTDVLWSPNHVDKYMTFGTDLSLFQVEKISYGQGKVDNRLSDDTYGTLLSSNTSHQYMKCVAWCPRAVPDHLVAVGQANGRVVLTSFGKGGTGDPEGLTGKQFVPKHPRQCNALCWNPLEPTLLAESLEKHRVDYSILIWDVNSRPMVSGPVTPERGHVDSTERNIITKPVVELGPGETTLSFNWSPHEPKTLVAGMNNKFLRIYDLRDTTHPRNVALNKAVHGITVDPHCEYRLASFVDNQVLIWDVRSFDKPVLTFQETRGVLKIAWCPTRFGLLASLAKESSVVKLYDVQHSGLGSDELEPAIIERLVHPYGHNAVSSFAWHPTDENRMLTVSPTGFLRDVRIFERIALTWSPSMYLLWSCGKKIVECVPDERVEEADDISMVMKMRAKMGYGLKESVWKNAKFADETLKNVWYWLDLMKNLQVEGRIKGSAKSIQKVYGAKAVLRGELNPTGSCNKSEMIPNVPWVGIETNKYSNHLKMYRSEERTKAMELCGWDFDRGDSSLRIFLENLESRDEYERAATISLFSLKMRLAIDVLKKGGVATGSANGKSNLNMVAMAISGYADDRNPLWKEMCGALRSELHNPYLRGMFAFLTSESDNFEDVVNESGMALQDRVAFACMYLNDSRLNDFIEKITARMIESGNLDGILLTGLSTEGLDLLQRYVDKTGDVQTASLVVIQGFPADISKDTRVVSWIDSYRDLLDRWRLWHERAEFDVHRFRCDTSSRPPQQVFVSCNFCGKSISYSMLTMGRTRHYTSFGGSPNKSKVTSCPGCRKPLPRCSLCLINMGTASGVARQKQKSSDCDGDRMTAFPKWFTWCQTCRHGGHAIHISKWFSEHKECPVTGCTCKCMTLDTASRLNTEADTTAIVKAS
ncbi:GATOR2 complex protein MIOS-B-like isoform X2 [Lineus longissimus]|uniref:GATOR2 complex protein MIOS-B-like isoform X2 n=1 Tax=Lineus longissimus TaxID=88925 RepID=UPI00315CEEED